MRIKNIIAAIAVATAFASATAQVPEGIRFQTILRNSQGQLIAQKQVGIRLTIVAKQGSSSTDLYSETFQTTTGADGMATIVFGTGTTSGSATFADIDWSTASGDRWMKVEVDPNGGTNYSVISGESQLLSAPYALMAKKAQEVGNLKFATVKVSITDAPAGLTPEVKLAGAIVDPTKNETVEVMAYTPTYLTLTYPQGTTQASFKQNKITDIAIKVNGKTIKPNINGTHSQSGAINIPVVEEEVTVDGTKYKKRFAYSGNQYGYAIDDYEQVNILPSSNSNVFYPVNGNVTINTTNYYEWSLGSNADIIVGPFISGQENTIEIIFVSEVN